MYLSLPILRKADATGLIAGIKLHKLVGDWVTASIITVYLVSACWWCYMAAACYFVSAVGYPCRTCLLLHFWSDSKNFLAKIFFI